MQDRLLEKRDVKQFIKQNEEVLDTEHRDAAKDAEQQKQDCL